MGLVDMVLNAYGVKKQTQAQAKGLADDGETTLCADNDPQCLAGLNKTLHENTGMSSLDGDDRRDEQRWVDMHEAIMRRSAVDKSISRWNLVWSLYKATPRWVKILLFVFLVVGALIALIPGLMIILEVLNNKIALFKVVVLVALAVLVLIGYQVIPM